MPKGTGYLGINVFNKLPQYPKEERDNPKKHSKKV